jgi:hypothetical protein
MKLGNSRGMRAAAVFLFGVLSVVMTGTTASAASTVPPSAGGGANPGVVPPDARYAGATYGQWSARWWQWVLSIGVADNPLLDTTGAKCGQAQSGPVWYLAGSTANDPVERSCTVPAGKALFFPLVNAFEAGNPPPPPRPSFKTELAAVRRDVKGETGFATIDGRTLKNVQQYHTESPDFGISLTADNIYSAPAGLYAPTAAAGLFLMLRPLSPGSHTIKFGGTLPVSGVNPDITYHLTVTR